MDSKKYGALFEKVSKVNSEGIKSGVNFPLPPENSIARLSLQCFFDLGRCLITDVEQYLQYHSVHLDQKTADVHGKYFSNMNVVMREYLTPMINRPLWDFLKDYIDDECHVMLQFLEHNIMLMPMCVMSIKRRRLFMGLINYVLERAKANLTPSKPTISYFIKEKSDHQRRTTLFIKDALQKIMTILSEKYKVTIYDATGILDTDLDKAHRNRFYFEDDEEEEEDEEEKRIRKSIGKEMIERYFSSQRSEAVSIDYNEDEDNNIVENFEDENELTSVPYAVVLDLYPPSFLFANEEKERSERGQFDMALSQYFKYGKILFYSIIKNEASDIIARNPKLFPETFDFPIRTTAHPSVLSSETKHFRQIKMIEDKMVNSYFVRSVELLFMFLYDMYSKQLISATMLSNYYDNIQFIIHKINSKEHEFPPIECYEKAKIPSLNSNIVSYIFPLTEYVYRRQSSPNQIMSFVQMCDACKLNPNKVFSLSDIPKEISIAMKALPYSPFHSEILQSIYVQQEMEIPITEQWPVVTFGRAKFNRLSVPIVLNSFMSQSMRYIDMHKIEPPSFLNDDTFQLPLLRIAENELQDNDEGDMDDDDEDGYNTFMFDKTEYGKIGKRMIESIDKQFKGNKLITIKFWQRLRTNGGIGTAFKEYLDTTSRDAVNNFFSNFEYMLKLMKTKLGDFGQMPAKLNDISKLIKMTITDVETKKKMANHFCQCIGNRKIKKSIQDIQKAISRLNTIHALSQEVITNRSLSKHDATSSNVDTSNIQIRPSFYPEMEDASVLVSTILYVLNQISLTGVVSKIDDRLKSHQIIKSIFKSFTLNQCLLDLAVKELEFEDVKDSYMDALEDLAKLPIASEYLPNNQEPSGYLAFSKWKKFLTSEIEVVANKSCPAWFKIPCYYRCILVNAWYPTVRDEDLHNNGQRLIFSPSEDDDFKMAPFSTFRRPTFMSISGPLISVIETLLHLCDCTYEYETNSIDTEITSLLKKVFDAEQDIKKIFSKWSTYSIPFTRDEKNTLEWCNTYNYNEENNEDDDEEGSNKSKFSAMMTMLTAILKPIGKNLSAFKNLGNNQNNIKLFLNVGKIAFELLSSGKIAGIEYFAISERRRLFLIWKKFRNAIKQKSIVCSKFEDQMSLFVFKRSLLDNNLLTLLSTANIINMDELTKVSTEKPLNITEIKEVVSLIATLFDTFIGSGDTAKSAKEIIEAEYEKIKSEKSTPRMFELLFQSIFEKFGKNDEEDEGNGDDEEDEHLNYLSSDDEEDEEEDDDDDENDDE